MTRWRNPLVYCEKCDRCHHSSKGACPPDRPSQHFALLNAYICLNCDTITDDKKKCPACGGGRIMYLAKWVISIKG